MTQGLAAYKEGLSRYRAREFRDALDAFRESIQLRAGDRPSELYIERCQHYLTHPPPDDWDCVWTLKEK